jgi:Ca-activated chloride channel family protein
MEGRNGREEMEEWKTGRMISSSNLPSFQPSNHPPFTPSILPFFLFKIIPVLLLFSACAWAWKSAGGSFANLWLTPDQQGARLLARQHYAEAAKHFHDPLWQGTALYRDGQFKEAAAAFARVDSPEAAFDRGNALLMHGKYGDAIASSDRALQRRPDWREAKANRDLAEARRQMLQPPKDDAGGTGGQLQADEIVFDDRPQQSEDSKEVEVVTGGQMSDEQLQALWLRRVQTKPADFLRAKFAYQLSRRQQEKPQP